MSEKETVLELGVEGGGATIFRTPLGDDDWRFHVEGTSMFLDENDDEDWRSWTTEPVHTIQEALRLIAEDGSWIYFYPTAVHPEYRMMIWELVQEIANQQPVERQEIWEWRSQQWERLCLAKS